MDNTISSTIEMIKLQEQEKEAKLKEKREIEMTLVSLSRAVRDTLQHTEKLIKEENEILTKIHRMKAELEVARVRRDAFLAQLKAIQKELEKSRIKSDQGISKVWEMRSSLCDTVQKVSDACDVWALLVRPTCTDIPRIIKKTDFVEPKLVNEERLKNALEKRDSVRAERDRLLAEPDAGEEFVRIKNALRYSLEMTSNLQN
ncbi:uncharacterized protein LOC128673452 [Plodia interpunctella]|uniref:uncharacterized protein LOC128673452 n=1 Tax=Plodia interpunctella TaxID=58824 RepID=UPI0023687718|nr:uncharacterized protein LOC128673452 [Plodia interpunctella]